ncbi:hypothetical protein DFQ26_001085, partial [Actinomortierella ambigua]
MGKAARRPGEPFAALRLTPSHMAKNELWPPNRHHGPPLWAFNQGGNPLWIVQ